MIEKLVVRGSNLFLIYAQYVSGIPTRVDLAYKYRSLTSTTWGSSTDIVTSVNEDEYVFNLSITYDDKIHLVYEKDGELEYRSYDGSWSSATTLDDDIEFSKPKGISSVSNDVYVTWLHDNSDYLRYRQYDAAPLTPANFAGTTYNNHPKLTWSLNNEPDMSGYEIYRLLTSGSGVYELLTTVSSGTSSYVDNGVQLGGSTMGRVFYKIRAKDNHPYYSGYTPVIRYNYSGLNKVTVENQSFEYLLSANYPNPFNPSTQIKYSLAQDADVTLKVYDMLGKEVAELVNETQTAGSYEINFNAENLSSGVYVYRISATNNGRILFTDSKQMILLR